MRLSIWPNARQTWHDLLAEVRHCDETGWDGVYLADHFMGDGGDFGTADSPNLESTAVLAALGASTTRLRIGPLVLGNTYRHPAVVANWAATLDRITDGRVVLGVGAGWQENEHRQYGIELPPPGERLERLEEACAVLNALLRSERATFEGRRYELHDALCEPKPVQAPLPLLIGGKGDRMLGVVARHADEWNMWGLPETLAARARVLEDHCARIGRDPASITRSTQARVMITDDPERARAFVEGAAPRAAFAGTAAEFAELVHRWAEVGVSEVIVPDADLGAGDRRLERLDAIRRAVG